MRRGVRRVINDNDLRTQFELLDCIQHILHQIAVNCYNLRTGYLEVVNQLKARGQGVDAAVPSSVDVSQDRSVSRGIAPECAVREFSLGVVEIGQDDLVWVRVVWVTLEEKLRYALVGWDIGFGVRGVVDSLTCHCNERLDPWMDLKAIDLLGWRYSMQDLRCQSSMPINPPYLVMQLHRLQESGNSLYLRQDYQPNNSQDFPVLSAPSVPLIQNQNATMTSIMNADIPAALMIH
ncbi:phenylacetyl- ligase [Ilyonectria robusta]